MYTKLQQVRPGEVVKKRRRVRAAASTKSRELLQGPSAETLPDPELTEQGDNTCHLPFKRDKPNQFGK